MRPQTDATDTQCDTDMSWDHQSLRCPLPLSRCHFGWGQVPLAATGQVPWEGMVSSEQEGVVVCVL